MAQQFTYKRNQKVKGGTLARTQQRLRKVGKVKGVDASDGITGREARKVKRVANRTHDGVPKQHKPRLSRDERSLRREVRAETRTWAAPQERAIADSRAQETEFARRNQGFYAQHQQDMLLAQQRNQAFQAGLLQGQNAAVQQAATTDQNANSSLLQKASADAAQRGATVDPALAQTMQAGVAARQATGVAGTTALAGQAQAQGSYMTSQSQQAGEQGILAQQDSQARLRKYDQLSEDLLRQEGDFRIKERHAIKQERHKNALEDAAFNVDTSNTLADNARADRTERRQAKNQRVTNRRLRQDDAEQRRHNRATERNTRRTENRMRAKDLADDGKLNGSAGGKDTNGNGKPDKYTQSQRNSAARDYRKARSVSSGIKGKPGQIISFLVNKKGIDPLVARAAVAPGTLTAGQRAELRRMGVHFKAGHPGSLTPRNPDGTPG